MPPGRAESFPLIRCGRPDRRALGLDDPTLIPIEERLTVLLDALGAFEDMPSWDDAADSLFNAGLTLNPSALHGAMAGLLGAGFSPHTEHHFAATVAASLPPETKDLACGRKHGNLHRQDECKAFRS